MLYVLCTLHSVVHYRLHYTVTVAEFTLWIGGHIVCTAAETNVFSYTTFSIMYGEDCVHFTQILKIHIWSSSSSPNEKINARSLFVVCICRYASAILPIYNNWTQLLNANKYLLCKLCTSTWMSDGAHGKVAVVGLTQTCQQVTYLLQLFYVARIYSLLCHT